MRSWILRASSRSSDWLARLRADPEVELRRGEESSGYVAHSQEDPETRERVNQAMAEKYGFSDRLLSMVVPPERAVPVRLEPAAD